MTRNYGLNVQLTDLDLLALRLGKVHCNLMSLEYLIRCFLTRVEGKDSVSDFPHVAGVGEQVIATALTDYRSLGNLIRDFNSDAKRYDRDLISDKIVALRDVLAHGRLGATQIDEGFRLLKYKPPERGNVEVTWNVEVTKEWLEKQNLLVRQSISTAVTHSNFRFPGSIRME
ncbi:MAG: hypothetical protein M3O74_06725 [Pseudomonadota bacterium]|nr:hypothetical protein [Pseudomonadota bacterium]